MLTIEPQSYSDVIIYTLLSVSTIKNTSMNLENVQVFKI